MTEWGVFMKKIISLLLSIIIVFTACAMNFTAAACTPINGEIDAECAKKLCLLQLDESCYNKELSQGVTRVSFFDGSVSIMPDRRADLTTAYFDIIGTNYTNLLKAAVAIQSKFEYYYNISRINVSSPNEATTSLVNVKVSLLDADFKVQSSASLSKLSYDVFGHEIELEPVAAKYLCLTIKIADENATYIPRVTLNKFDFEWISGNCEKVEEVKEATCQLGHVKVYCKNCGYVFSSRVLPNYDDHKPIEVPEIPATCSQTGRVAGEICEVCGMNLTYRPIIPKLPHNETVVNSAKETYFAKGYTGDTVCADCGKVINKGKVIKKLTLKVPKFKLVKGKKQFKVKYIKVKDATGFEIRYRLSNKKWKSVKVKTKKSMTKVIKNLKKGKYTVRIRSLITKNKKTAYSSWSNSKTISVK